MIRIRGGGDPLAIINVPGFAPTFVVFFENSLVIDFYCSVDGRELDVIFKHLMTHHSLLQLPAEVGRCYWNA